MHLLPWDAIEALALHYAKGAEKYAPRNWELGLNWNEGIASSLARHLGKWAQGEDVCKIDGTYHDVSIAWGGLALVTYRLRGVGLDDRPRMGQSQQQSVQELLQPLTYLDQKHPSD
jgi:hypothetical protein